MQMIKAILQRILVTLSIGIAIGSTAQAQINWSTAVEDGLAEIQLKDLDPINHSTANPDLLLLDRNHIATFKGMQSPHPNLFSQTTTAYGFNFKLNNTEGTTGSITFEERIDLVKYILTGFRGPNLREFSFVEIIFAMQTPEIQKVAQDALGPKLHASVLQLSSQNQGEMEAAKLEGRISNLKSIAPTPEQIDTLYWLRLVKEFNLLKSKKATAELDSLDEARLTVLYALISKIPFDLIKYKQNQFNNLDGQEKRQLTLDLAKNGAFIDAITEVKSKSTAELVRHLDSNEVFRAVSAFLIAEDGNVTDQDRIYMNRLKLKVIDQYKRVLNEGILNALEKYSAANKTVFAKAPKLGKLYYRSLNYLNENSKTATTIYMTSVLSFGTSAALLGLSMFGLDTPVLLMAPILSASILGLKLSDHSIGGENAVRTFFRDVLPYLRPEVRAELKSVLATAKVSDSSLETMSQLIADAMVSRVTLTCDRLLALPETKALNP